MMNFPNSPSDGQIVTQTNGVTYRWNLAKTRWDAVVNQTQQVVAVGMIAAFAESVNDADWLFCDGSAVSRSTYAVLFAKIGVMYGAGNGSTTFNLPDYRGEFLRGQDAGAGVDPDAASRLWRGDGIGGDIVGSKQLDEFKLHNHTNGFFVTSNSRPDSLGGAPNPALTNTGNTGGSETRPVNTYVRYYIFAGATMGVHSGYREGTWTPQIGTGGVIYASGYLEQSGSWERIGNQVTIRGRIRLSNLGPVTGSTTIAITNLPFEGDPATDNQAALTFGGYTGLNIPANSSVSGFVSGKIATLRVWSLAQGTDDLSASALTNNGDLIFSGTYRAEP